MVKTITHSNGQTLEVAFEGEDDAAELVPVCGFQYPEDEADQGANGGFDVEQFLVAVLTGADSVSKLGERLLLTAYVLKIPGAPENLRDLGGFLGVSHTMARKKLARYQADFRRELRAVGFQRP